MDAQSAKQKSHLKSSPADILRNLQRNRRIIQDFSRIPESIEWAISQRLFRDHGSKVFGAQNHVPLTPTSDGNLSRAAADLLFQNLEESAPNEIHVLEFGAGSGLFARFFLDSFQELCQQHHKDFYSRLTYWVTDSSSQMIEDIETVGILKAHKEHVELRVCDALDPQSIWHSERDANSTCPQIQAVFLNYLLDVLPVTHIRRRNDGFEELFIRTCLARSVDSADYKLDLDELECLTQQGDTGLDRLLELYHSLAIECAFLPVQTKDIPHAYVAERLLSEDGKKMALNFGALTCISGLAKLLTPIGFVLVNDYVGAPSGMAMDTNPYQRFAMTVACYIDFSAIELFATESCGLDCLQPVQDGQLIRSRLICSTTTPAREFFRLRFSRPKIEYPYARIDSAQKLVAEGMFEQALFEYELAMRALPFNWHLADLVSQVLSTHLHQYQAAKEMAEFGLELNPACSSSLWCTLGDSLLGLKEQSSAQRCYEKGIAIDSRSSRAHLGTALCRLEEHDYGGALSWLARALYLDKDCRHRDYMLTKLTEILRRAEQRRKVERDNFVNRVSVAVEYESYDGSSTGLK